MQVNFGAGRTGHRTVRAILAGLLAIALLASPLLIGAAYAVTADPGGPYTGVVGAPVAFDGSGSNSDDTNIRFYVWNFGDGTDAVRFKTPYVTHTYQEAKVYTVTLRVIDEDRNEDSATTTATIEDPVPTTTTTTTTTTSTTTTLPTTTTSTSTTTSTTLPTTTTSTSTTTTSTTTTSTTTTTQPTTTTGPSTTTTAAQPTSTTTATTRPSGTTASTDTTSTTLDVLGLRTEAPTGPAAGISAASFSVAPQTWTPGHEVAITLELNATTPGIATVLFLLDGSQLGDPAVTNTGTAATFTRVLPTDLSVGSHRIELVDAEDPSQTLASRTVGVAATDAGIVPLPQQNSPVTAGNDSSVVPALIGIAGLIGLGALAWHNRRRWIPRRGL